MCSVLALLAIPRNHLIILHAPPSGIDDQPVAEPSGYTPVGSSSPHSGCITSGLDAIGYQSSLNEGQSTNASSRFVTKVYSHSALTHIILHLLSILQKFYLQVSTIS
ncbi:ANM_collapsed_G0017950.mRNA.1.CDS.1 [Saccharomyces cerevisiae]|nr:ANM_collapsed_G0017950.mRNA.1.CDS.1 [Saccharomyces cerevisiae]